jgi:hypothetical protein
MIPDIIIKILIIGGMIIGTICGIYAYTKVNIFHNKTLEQIEWLSKMATSQPMDGYFNLGFGDGKGSWDASISFHNGGDGGFEVSTNFDGKPYTLEEAVEALVEKVKLNEEGLFTKKY